MKKIFENLLKKNEKILALKNIDEIDAVIKSSAKIIFILSSNIMNIEEITRALRMAEKISFVHMDMVTGLEGKSEYAVEFIKENTYATGIISTKSNIIKYAKKNNLLTIQRCFLIDSLSVENIEKIINESYPDAVEILPGIIPKMIKKIANRIKIPLIAGGLIMEEEDIKNAFDSGASAISTTNIKLIKK